MHKASVNYKSNQKNALFRNPAKIERQQLKIVTKNPSHYYSEIKHSGFFDFYGILN